MGWRGAKAVAAIATNGLSGVNADIIAFAALASPHAARSCATTAAASLRKSSAAEHIGW
jgi:ABC-type enterobactin transport system permease subunit